MSKPQFAEKTAKKRPPPGGFLCESVAFLIVCESGSRKFLLNGLLIDAERFREFFERRILIAQLCVDET